MNDNRLHIDRIKKAVVKIGTYLVDKGLDDLKTNDLLYDAVLIDGVVFDW